MGSIEDFRQKKHDETIKKEFYFLVFLIIISIFGYFVWEPIIYLILIPILRLLTFINWKKENNKINKEIVDT